MHYWVSLFILKIFGTIDNVFSTNYCGWHLLTFEQCTCIKISGQTVLKISLLSAKNYLFVFKHQSIEKCPFMVDLYNDRCSYCCIWECVCYLYVEFTYFVSFKDTHVKLLLFFQCLVVNWYFTCTGSISGK